MSSNPWGNRRQGLQAQGGSFFEDASLAYKSKSAIVGQLVDQVKVLEQHVSQMDEALKVRRGSLHDDKNFKLAKGVLTNIIQAYCLNSPSFSSQAENTEIESAARSPALFK